MAVKIRLARLGKVHSPIYRIVVIDSRRKRDGQALDILGTYDPIKSKIINFHKDKIDSWILKGALMTDAVKKIYKMNNRLAQ